MRVTVALLFTCLVFGAVHSSLPQANPAFGFELHYGYLDNVIDTWKGTFTRDSAVPGASIALELKLNAEELSHVQQLLRSIDFWNNTKYPSEFKVPENCPCTSVDPYETFSFRVTENGVTKTLHWADSINVNDTRFRPAVELRGTFHRIRDLVQSKAEFANLPPRQVFPR
jgi:hypothetical protein